MVKNIYLPWIAQSRISEKPGNKMKQINNVEYIQAAVAQSFTYNEVYYAIVYMFASVVIKV